MWAALTGRVVHSEFDNRGALSLGHVSMIIVNHDPDKKLSSAWTKTPDAQISAQQATQSILLLEGALSVSASGIVGI